MLFITNRFLRQGPTPTGLNNLPRKISFADDNRVEQSVYFCRRQAYKDYIEIGHQQFFNELKYSHCQQILFYLHGFNSLPEKSIFQTAGKLQDLLNQQSNHCVEVVPLIWPCDDDFGILGDYFDDQKAADASDFAFMRLFEKFLNWRESNSTLDNPCTKRLNILAHSMGSRVLRGALTRAVKYYLAQGVPLLFRNIFMSAADMVNESLEPEQEGKYIVQAARNVIVYYAADDLALRSSKVANVRNGIASRRLGHTGPENMDKVANNVYALDCGDFNNSYDPPLGHGYFTSDSQNNPGLLFKHMWQCIRTGRVLLEPPGNRRQILTPELLEDV